MNGLLPRRREESAARDRRRGAAEAASCHYWVVVPCGLTGESITPAEARASLYLRPLPLSPGQGKKQTELGFWASTQAEDSQDTGQESLSGLQSWPQGVRELGQRDGPGRRQGVPPPLQHEGQSRTRGAACVPVPADHDFWIPAHGVPTWSAQELMRPLWFKFLSPVMTQVVTSTLGTELEAAAQW